MVVDDDVAALGAVVVTASVVVVVSAVLPFNARAAAVPIAANRTTAATATSMIHLRLFRLGGAPQPWPATLGVPGGYGSAGAAFA